MDLLNSKEYFEKEYCQKQRSFDEIAEELGTYPNKVRRAAKRLGIAARSRGEAQAVALASGRQEHPSAGKTMSEATRVAISEAQHALWKNMSDEEKEARCQRAKEQWKNMTREQHEKLLEASHKAVRATSKFGSKMEKYIEKNLAAAGYAVQFHKKGLLANPKLEIDMFIPEIRTAIEIDGPSHFLPIWGQRVLERNMRSDSEKAGLLMKAGMCVVRVKCLVERISKKNLRDTWDMIFAKIKEIEVVRPPEGQRYIELELS